MIYSINGKLRFISTEDAAKTIKEDVKEDAREKKCA